MEGIRGLLLILYTTFSFSAYFFFITEKDTYWIRWTLLVFAVSVMRCPVLFRWMRRMNLPEASAEGTAKRKWDLFLFCGPFLALFVKYLVYYPGAFSTDSLWQYEQAVSGLYDDWHPAIQTLLAIKLPLLLTGGWVGSIALFQVVALSLTIGYGLRTVQEAAGNRFALGSMGFILLNPTISNDAMFPWKDVTFGIGALLLVSFAVRIVLSGGEWLRKPVNAAVLGIVAALTSIVRHNGVLFTVPLMLAVTLWAGWKKTIMVLIGAVVLVAGIRGPLYGALSVETREKARIEMLGLPLNVIASVAKYAPGDLDEETRAFVEKAAPKVSWDQYEYGNFNNVKWSPGFDEAVIEKYGNRIVPMVVSCLARSPREALKGLIRLTDVVYTLCDDYTYFDFPVILENDFGIRWGGVPMLQTVNEKISLVLYTVLPWLFLYVGAMHYGLMALVMAKFRLNRWRDWKRVLFVLPVFAYNFGTTLLLTSAHDSSRFFMYTFLVMPGMIALLIGKEKKEKGTGWPVGGGT